MIGTRVHGTTMVPRPTDGPVTPSVMHDAARCQFVLRWDGVSDAAFVAYEVVQGGPPTTWDVVHTYVPEGMRGRGVAGQVVAAAFAHARTHGVRLIPTCTYIPVWLRRHPEEADVVAAP
jgi:uncharacterized protein